MNMQGSLAPITTLKILVIGESAVGKSSLLLRFVDDKFDAEQPATIGRLCFGFLHYNFLPLQASTSR